MSYTCDHSCHAAGAPNDKRSVVCTLTGDMYRYTYGNYNPWEVPFVPEETVSLCCGQNDRAAFQLLLYSGEEMTVSLENAPALHKTWPVRAVRVSCELEETVPGGEAACMGEGFPDVGETQKRAETAAAGGGAKEGGGIVSPAPAGCRISLSLVEGIRDDDGDYKTEVLLSARKKRQERLRVQPVWIELETGEDMAPGNYQGIVRVCESLLFEDERPLAVLPFTVKVLPVRLPPLSESRFRLDLWQHHTSIARTYETALWGEEHFSLMESYLETLEQLGQTAATVIVSEAPWSGQWSAWYRTNPSDVFEYNMVRVTRDREGSFHYDFSVMERYIRLCHAHKIDREIEIFGLAGVWTLPDAGLSGVLEDSEEAVRIRYFDESSGRLCYIRRQEELDAYLRAVDQNLFQNGWARIARVACDEPADGEAFERTLKRLSELMPHMRFKVTICSGAVLEKEYGQISDCVVNLPLLLQEEGTAEKLAGRYALSYYTAMEPPHPNTFLCCEPAEIRFLPWLSLLLGLDGYLRWAAWLWPDRPFDWDSYHYQKFRAGGMQFLYPGKNGKPLYSLRYKQLERGLRDYLILEEYGRRSQKEKVGAEAAEKLMKTPLADILKCRRASDFMCMEQEAFDEIINGALEALAALPDLEEGGRIWQSKTYC